MLTVPADGFHLPGPVGVATFTAGFSSGFQSAVMPGEEIEMLSSPK